MDDAVQAGPRAAHRRSAAHPRCQPQSASPHPQPARSRYHPSGRRRRGPGRVPPSPTPRPAHADQRDQGIRRNAARGRRRWRRGRAGRRSRQAAGRSNPAARPDRRSGDVFRWRYGAIGRNCSRHRRGRRIDEDGREPAQGSPPDHGEGSRPCRREPSRILVVDDNASNRDLLSRRLQRQGHTVLQAEDGTIALAMVEKEALDLVLLDLMMPGISGYDVLARLKSDPRFRKSPSS